MMPLQQMFGDDSANPAAPSGEQPSPPFEGDGVSVQTWPAPTPRAARRTEPGPVPEPPAGDAGPPPAAPAPAAAAAPRSPGSAGSKGKPTAAELDELAKRLYEPLSARLRTELWLDRERSGRSMTR